MARGNRLSVRPISPVVGAVIDGVELRKPLGPGVVHALREAVLEHGAAIEERLDLKLRADECLEDRLVEPTL